MEVFYPDADLRVRHHNLGAVLHVLPPATLPLLRRLTIVLTRAQCYYWFGRAPDFAHPEWQLRDMAKSEPGWPGEEDKTANHYRPNLRAALARLAAEADPARLNLQLDLEAVHAFSGMFLGANYPDHEDRFRWTYDLCVDGPRWCAPSSRACGACASAWSPMPTCSSGWRGRCWARGSWGQLSRRRGRGGLWRRSCRRIIG